MPDRLSIRLGYADAELTYIDMDKPPLRSSWDTPICVKNMSGHYRATGVTVAIENATPQQAAQMLLSADGGRTFTGVLDLGDLAPQVASPMLLLRRNSDADAPLGPQTVTLAARASGWQ